MMAYAPLPRHKVSASLSVVLVFAAEILINQGMPKPSNFSYLYAPRNWRTLSHVILCTLLIFYLFILE